MQKKKKRIRTPERRVSDNRRRPERDVPEVADTFGPEPHRADRPSLEELGGLSEFEATAASASENLDEAGDPLRPMASSPKAPHPEEEITVSPEDLGRHFLKEAVQDPNPIEPIESEVFEMEREEGPTDDLEEVTNPDADAADEPPPLTTHMEDRTEHEHDVSEKAQRAVGRQVRRRRQAGKPPHLR